MNTENQEIGVSTNRLLDALSGKDLDLVLSKSDLVELRQEARIYRSKQEIKWVYFPTTAMLSWVTSTETGEAIEVGISGCESMVGLPIFLECNFIPYQVQVQLPGLAWKLKAETFKELCDALPSLQKRMRQYTYLVMHQFAQSCVCNRFHNIEQRLSRWLLTALDRASSPELPFTKEILAGMIGARRPAVSIVVSRLQSAGLIRSSRGKVTINDRKGLEKAACECYETIRKVFDWFIEEKLH